MNQKLKYVGLLAILLVLSVALVASPAQAEFHPAKSELHKKLVRDKICGEKLCSEVKTKEKR